jgi:hypothetical protein
VVTSATPTRKLVEVLFSGDLEAWVSICRGAGQSWRSIAWDLNERLGGECTISHETLRAWFAEVDIAIPLDLTG